VIVAELTLLVALAQQPSRVCVGASVDDPRAFPAMLVRRLPVRGLDGEIRVTVRQGAFWPFGRIGGQWRALQPPFAVWPYRFPCATGLPSTAMNTGVPPLPLPLDHLVALVFSDTDIQPVKLAEAERMYVELEAKRIAGLWEDADRRLHAALVIALGTLPDERLVAPGLPGSRERLDWEIRRGVRTPRVGEWAGYRDY